MAATPALVDCDPKRVQELFEAHQARNWHETDRLFAMLMLAQWAFAVILALTLSPYAWAGKQQTVHLHLQAALGLGALLISFPLLMVHQRPGTFATRVVIASTQMLWSALLIHLTGGRIETHFHVFGSLAFVAFYRDWRLLIPATLVVVVDHALRGIYWPESVYGIVNPEWWRFLEHAGWVVFEDAVLFAACLRGEREIRAMAVQQAQLEAKYAAAGRLAASVAHELRNPLAAMKNATAYLTKFVPPSDNRRIPEFLNLIDREVDECTAILGDLIEYARERPVLAVACSLRTLTAEAIAKVRPRVDKKVKVENEIPADLAPVQADADQLRRALGNLMQNAIDTFPKGREGTVRVRAESGAKGWRITVQDDGDQIPAAQIPNIFEPLITEQQRNTSTGLGLAIVATVVERHRGTVACVSGPTGTTFTIDLPPGAERSIR